MTAAPRPGWAAGSAWPPGHGPGTPNESRPSTDWLRNRLRVSGPRVEVEAFQAAARGTNAVPWHLDLDHEEARLLAPIAAAGPPARALARELREAIAARHAKVLAGWALSGTCPLDLHRLIPVPRDILQLGEDHPAARHWRQAYWGTERLRQVRIIEQNADRRRRRTRELVIEFWSADWTPWQAIRRLRRDWPALVFAVVPHYDDAHTGDARTGDSRTDG